METDPSFCRVCFTQEENEEYIEVLGSSAHVELMSVGNIEVFEGDPNLICKRCKVILSNSYKFKQICKRSENLLKTFPITKKIPPKIVIAQEKLPSDKKEGNEKPKEEKKSEMISVSVGHEQLEMKESSTQTESLATANTCIEQMEMIIASDETFEATIPCIIAPPTLFEDESINDSVQFSIVQEEKESRKPKILSNEPVKILNKSLINVATAAPKQFKKTSNMKIDKIIPDTKPKILNTQLKLHQIKSPIIESIEETPDGNIEIITYDNEEYLEEEQILDEKKAVVDDKSEDGVVYTCDVCDRSFPLLQQLEIHKQNHDRARNFPCEYCEKAFFTKYDLAKHLLTHTKQKDYTCVVCKKSFSRSTLLYRHEKIHTDPNIPRYHCEHCDRVYLNSVDYEKHQITHNKTRPFACNYCEKRFAFKQGLERHEIIHDTKSMPHKCQYCPERFKTAARLQRHLSAAHAGTRAFPCSKCNKRFMLSHHLYRHMRTSHRNEDEEITIQCPECDISFEQREVFFDHCLEHVTTSLICPMCKYKGEDHSDINAHVLLHCKSDMYFCDYCSCIFMTQAVLNEHFIEKHSDELCAIGEDEIEFVVEKKPVAKETAKRTREKTTDSPKTSKRVKQQVQYDEAPITAASYVEFEEEIVEPVKVSRSKANKKEDVPKVSPKKSSPTTTIQRVKMSQSEIQRLQREGKIVMQDGVLIMKQ